jgi:hypothetical protein
MALQQMCLRTFTENVIILAAENCLIRHIPDVFEPTKVGAMSDEAVSTLGAEAPAVREERKRLERELKVLESGLRECKRLKPRTVAGTLPLSRAASVPHLTRAI